MSVPLADYLGEIAWYIDPFLSRSPQGMEVLAPAASLAGQGRTGRWGAEFRRRQPAHPHHPYRAADARSRACGACGLRDRRRKQLPGGHRPGPRLHTDVSGARSATGGVPDPPARSRAALSPDPQRRPAAAAGSPARDCGHDFPESVVHRDAGRSGAKGRHHPPMAAGQRHGDGSSQLGAGREGSLSGHTRTRCCETASTISALPAFSSRTTWSCGRRPPTRATMRSSKQFPYSFHTALPYIDKPEKDHKWPGRAFKPADTEVAQLEFMRQWDRCMKVKPVASDQPDTAMSDAKLSAVDDGLFVDDPALPVSRGGACWIAATTPLGCRLIDRRRALPGHRSRGARRRHRDGRTTPSSTRT